MLLEDSCDLPQATCVCVCACAYECACVCRCVHTCVPVWNACACMSPKGRLCAEHLLSSTHTPCLPGPILLQLLHSRRHACLYTPPAACHMITFRKFHQQVLSQMHGNDMQIQLSSFTAQQSINVQYCLWRLRLIVVMWRSLKASRAEVNMLCCV